MKSWNINSNKKLSCASTNGSNNFNLKPKSPRWQLKNKCMLKLNYRISTFNRYLRMLVPRSSQLPCSLYRYTRHSFQTGKLTLRYQHVVDPSSESLQASHGHLGMPNNSHKPNVPVGVHPTTPMATQPDSKHNILSPQADVWSQNLPKLSEYRSDRNEIKQERCPSSSTSAVGEKFIQDMINILYMIYIWPDSNEHGRGN